MALSAAWIIALFHDFGPTEEWPYRYQIPAADTVEGIERIRAYYEALGQFVTWYAEAEAVTQQALSHYAETRPAITRSLFSGTRVSAAASFIRRICEATRVDISVRDELKDIFAQMAAITTMRDNVLHYGARSVAEGKGVVTNALRAHIPDRVQTFPISPDILDNMTADLRRVIFDLLSRHVGRPGPLGAPNLSLLDGGQHGPWRYKPVQLPLPEDHKREGPDDPNHTRPRTPPPPSQG